MDWRDAVLKTKGADRPCEACGNTIWSYAPADVALPLTANGALLTAADGSTTSITVTPRMCGNCGLLRLHVADYLRPAHN